MNRKKRILLKMNIVSLFFIALSFVSITLAWFAYSGLAKVETDVNVKAWYIEFQKDNSATSNDIIISLDDIYPGMEPSSEKIDIKNFGDSDAMVTYQITSARILDEEISVSDEDMVSLIDRLSHDYPFHINVGLSSSLAVREVGSSELNVSVSWPMDSDNDEADSQWGVAAFKFKKQEEEKKAADPSYQIRSPLRITINMRAEQFTDDVNSLDPKYNLGNTLLFDPVNNVRCSKISTTCLKMYVIDTANKVGDKTVTLMPDLYKAYGPSRYDNRLTTLNNAVANWQVPTDELSVEHLLRIISSDVVKSTLSREKLSDSIIGSMHLDERVYEEIDKAKDGKGYFTFDNTRNKMLVRNGCYWLKNEYSSTSGFAVQKYNQIKTEILGLDKMSSCNVVPIISVDKKVLEQ